MSILSVRAAEPVMERMAFAKVGVKSRRELLKRLFFEHILPGMLAD